MKDGTVAMNKHHRHKSSRNDGVLNMSEPMRIQVTIYSMAGIRRQNVDQVQTKTPQPKFMVPTTALVSVRGQLIRTLVPSAPVAFHKQRKGETSLRGIAFWQNVDSGEEKQQSKDDLPPTTFELFRDMKRQAFQPNAKIEQMSHYVPERVDLVVGIARGKDILPLGTSTIAVSGEEEGELITNVPIKSLPMKIDRKSGKNLPTKGSIFIGDKHWYSLDSNAVLRVGIRVLPRNNYIPKTMATVVQPDSPRWNNMEKFIELNDENSLIAKFKSEHQASSNSEEENRSSSEQTKGYTSILLCGALECWSPLPTPVPAKNLEKISEAQVLTVRGLSDVSGSTVRWNRMAGQYAA